MFNFAENALRRAKIQKARFQRVQAFLEKLNRPGPPQLSGGEGLQGAPGQTPQSNL